MNPWHLKIKTPFGMLGMRCDDFAVLETEYLPRQSAAQPPQNYLAKEAARQMRAYLRRPRGFVFELPLLSAPTAHQRRVRDALMKVAGGEKRTYGDIARQIKSSPRAVGGACRANFLPLLVPCHRIVAANGEGGFMGDGADMSGLKRALLKFEEA
ncbi:MAG: methylated-DNA--[protein]-cysteine S-methyltransferase [Gammaproteobacteria bacterium]